MTVYYRKKTSNSLSFKTPIIFKPRRFYAAAHMHTSESLGDHDYTTPPSKPQNTSMCIELKESEDIQEDKDKDYYFMDTTLIGKVQIHA
jgi:hypothetical protein